MSFSSYGNYKDTNVAELGEVPAHWNVVPLKHVVETPITDGPHETPEFIDDGIPFVSAEAVSSGEINFSKSRFISHADHHKYSKKYKPRRDDIFMVKSGATTGVVALVSTDRDFNIWSPLAVVRCARLAFPRYVLQTMRSRNFQESVVLNWSFGTQQNIGMSVIENLRIPLPPIPEQNQIARFLDHETARIDALIEEQQRLIELLKEKRQAVISHAVTKGLDPTVPMKDSGVEWLGEVPAHWSVKALRYLGECQNGINIGGEAFGSGSPFVSYGDVYKNDVLPAEVTGLVQSSPEDQQRYSIEYGDVFFTRTSETVDEIGFSATCLQELPNAVFAGFLIRFRPTRKSLMPGFSKYYFRNQGLRIFFNKEMNLVTRASLSQDLLKQLPVTLPPIVEQIMISDFLDKVTAELASLLEQGIKAIDLLKERRSALISAAVTGKIDVRGWQPPARAQAPVLEAEAV